MKKYNKEKAREYYQANKDKIKERLRNMTPEKKHERQEKARMHRYQLKHGSLDGFEARAFGTPKVYKTKYYEANKDKILDHYKNLSPEEKSKRKEQSRKSRITFNEKHRSNHESNSE